MNRQSVEYLFDDLRRKNLIYVVGSVAAVEKGYHLEPVHDG